jgi:serine/threonine protein kinase
MLLGGYRLLKLMTQGQTSQVYEAMEPSSGRHYAIKLLLPESSRDPQHRRYLIHEAEVGMKLQHGNVIRILKLVRTKDNPFILMEYFPGANMKLRLMRKDPLLKEKAHSIIEQAAKGLLHVNEKGYVHRDVKPDNILVNATGDVRIIDFALAQRIRRTSFLGRLFRKKKPAQGTRSYMSPEQISGGDLTARSDLYSFGASIYELATDRPPFRGASPGDLLKKHMFEKPASPQAYNTQITDEFSGLVLRMLSKKPEDRPKDFAEFLAAFRAVKVFKGDTLEIPQGM